MPSVLEPIAEWSAASIELLGVLIIAGSALYTLLYGTFQIYRRNSETYHLVRIRLGRGILLGLEFLVAADIIHTVAVDLSFESVGVLAVILLARTFLSFTLEVELTGSWPWQEKRKL